MKSMKKFTALLLAALFAVTLCGAADAASAEMEAVYEIGPDGNAEVVGYTGEGSRITIRSEYDGRPVVRIADSAFEDCAALESVTLWADVKEIGDCAFKGCASLTGFSVPSETTLIGRRAFEGCGSLKTLTIWGDPDIGEYAFANCTSLTSISIGGDTKNVGAHAFEGCTGISSLVIWGAEIIGDYAFAGCAGIKSVSFPSDVLSIGDHAFDGCAALSRVTVWGRDTAIGTDAFANCPDLDDPPEPRGTVLQCTLPAPDDAEDAPDEAPAAADGIRPGFKAAMDSYEAFYAEYCDLLAKYKEDPTDLRLLAKYGEMLARADEMDEAFDAWDEDEMNSAELKYYLEVNDRVMKMLIDAAG